MLPPGCKWRITNPTPFSRNKRRVVYAVCECGKTGVPVLWRLLAGKAMACPSCSNKRFGPCPRRRVSRPGERPPCRHCLVNKSDPWRKGLCQGCSKRPEVRILYPTESKFGRRSEIEPSGERPLPPEPTIHPPGSPDKVNVMEWRAANRFHIHHPPDARWVGDERTTEWIKMNTKKEVA